jgi:hypothetical protein
MPAGGCSRRGEDVPARERERVVIFRSADEPGKAPERVREKRPEEGGLSTGTGCKSTSSSPHKRPHITRRYGGCRNMNIPDFLEYRINLFRTAAGWPGPTGSCRCPACWWIREARQSRSRAPARYSSCSRIFCDVRLEPQKASSASGPPMRFAIGVAAAFIMSRVSSIGP